MTIPFTAANQDHSVITFFNGTNGADLHGATITAHVRVVTAGNAGALQLYTQDVNYHSDYQGFVSLPTGTADVVYHVPAQSLTDPDAGTVLYDTSKIKLILFSVKSAAPPDGSASSPTTVWIDSITISGAPAPIGGGTYDPFTFDTSILPFSDNGGAPGTVSWIP
jgi:hypothetical protein